MLFFFVRDSYRPAYGKLDVLVSIFPKTSHLATTAAATLKSQRAIYSLQLKQLVVISINPDRRNIFFKIWINRKAFMICVWSYWRKNWHASYFDIWHTGCVYFCNVLGENQYFLFDAYPKSGFWFLFFNFSFCCIVALSFCNLPKLKMLMDCCSSCMQAPVMWN